jgi:hypothetical protein
MQIPMTPISYQKQEGVVIFMSLVLLVIMTLLGISAMESTKLQTRMAANLTEYHRTLQLASETGRIQLLDKYTKSFIGVQEIKLAPFSEEGTKELGVIDKNTGRKAFIKYRITKSETETPEGSLNKRYYILQLTGYITDTSSENDDDEGMLELKLEVGMESSTSRDDKILNE